MAFIRFTDSPTNQHVDVMTPEAFTADTTLVAADLDRILCNSGASGTVNLTLPAATVGAEWRGLICAAGKMLKFIAGGTDSLNWQGWNNSGSATHVYSSEGAANIHCVCVEAGKWVVWGQAAGWSIG